MNRIFRSSALLPVLVVLFGLGGANLAMAANASTDKPDKVTAASSDQHEAKTTTKAVTSDPSSCTSTTESCANQGN